MEDKEKETLLRTKRNVLDNLDSINDVVEANGFPIADHMILDDIKDSIKILRGVREIVGDADAFERVQAPSVPA